MGKSKIGRTDETWNCIRGCTEVSPGCAHCYAREQAARIVRMDAARRAANPTCKAGSYDRVVRIRNGKARWTDVVEFDAEKLVDPLRWRQPRRVFVNSMSDLFHESLTNEQIAAVFGVIAACPQHTFQVLTKRARRMREWFEWIDEQIEAEANDDSGADCSVSIHDARAEARASFLANAAADELSDGSQEDHDRWYDRLSGAIQDGWARTGDDGGTEWTMPWPLPNVWQGVSVEDRKHGVPRIDDLRQVTAAVRMLSCEPLLEDLGPLDLTGIGWLIDGCESGPGTRPAEAAWFASLEAQCRAAGVAYFHKQEVLDGKLVHDFPGRQEFPS